MMSAETLRYLHRRAALEYAAEQRQPYHPRTADEARAWTKPLVTIPWLGLYRPDDWRLIDWRDVNKGNRAFPNELNHEQLKQWVADTITADETAAFALLEGDEWTSRVGYFTQDDSIAVIDDIPGYTVNFDELPTCPHCGASYDPEDEGAFCPSCGQRLNNPVIDNHEGFDGAYAFGKADYKDDVEDSDNPYPDGSEAAALWLKGWTEMALEDGTIDGYQEDREED